MLLRLISQRSEGADIPPPMTTLLTGREPEPMANAMISDDDIKMCASALVLMFGKDAPVRAAERADECLAQGEDKSYAFWKRMEEAIEELLSSDPGLGYATLHLPSLPLRFHRTIAAQFQTKAKTR